VGTQFLHAPNPKWKYDAERINLALDGMYDGPLNAKLISMPPATGELVAWDPVAQKAAWRVTNPTVEDGGVLATGGNLVFQGRGDGMLAAYRATDGKQLWMFDAGTGNGEVLSQVLRETGMPSSATGPRSAPARSCPSDPESGQRPRTRPRPEPARPRLGAGVERRHGYAGALEGPQRVPGVEVAVEVAALHRLLRDADSATQATSCPQARNSAASPFA
jgi:hypothetical protein